jgi:hypothetical protein
MMTVCPFAANIRAESVERDSTACIGADDEEAGREPAHLLHDGRVVIAEGWFQLDFGGV